MALYDIELSVDTGMTYETGSGNVELSDSEVQQIVSLIKECQTTNVKKMELETKFPNIYAKLYDVCDDIAYHILGMEWCDVVLRNAEDVNVRKLMEHCDYIDEKKPGSASTKTERFGEWFDGFWKSASFDERYEICINYLGCDEYDINESLMWRDESYEVQIPQDIINLAKLQ